MERIKNPVSILATYIKRGECCWGRQIHQLDVAAPTTGFLAVGCVFLCIKSVCPTFVSLLSSSVQMFAHSFILRRGAQTDCA
jgi:hypothetical protein